MAFISHLLFFSAVLSLVATVYCSQEEEALHDILFKSYSRYVRPVASVSDPLEVNIGFTPLYIEEASQEGGFAKLFGYLSINWTDSKLSWNPNDFGSIESFAVNSDEVWTPDIIPYDAIMDHLNVKLLLKEDGSVIQVLPAHFRMLCDFKAGYPVGKMSCSTKFGPWVQSASQITLSKQDMDLSQYKARFGWEISKANIVRNVISYECCPEPYENVQVNLEFQKKVTKIDI